MDTGNKQDPSQIAMEDENKTGLSPEREKKKGDLRTKETGTDEVENSLPSGSIHASSENQHERIQKAGDVESNLTKTAAANTDGIEVRGTSDSRLGLAEGNGNTQSTPTQKKNINNASQTSEHLLAGSNVVGTSNVNLMAEKDPVKNDVGGNSVGVGKVSGQLPTVMFERDYSRGMMAQFGMQYPDALNGLFAREILEQTITGINEILWRAEETTRDTVLEGVAACLTFYLIYLVKESYYSKCLVELDRFIAEQNDAHYLPVGLEVQHPIESGFRILVIGPVRR
eukprot:comp6623_c0_seq1/m.2397 comp6623_c0_seq1/g.2397  ORF comp6623_c0_seq1/g.2397 comp6623_c0_seq1/m.2397 type:complete len:284 (-) comp6623_c0_seq1:462-1313(-)